MYVPAAPTLPRTHSYSAQRTDPTHPQYHMQPLELTIEPVAVTRPQHLDLIPIYPI